MAKTLGVKEELAVTSRGWTYKQLCLDIRVIKESVKGSKASRNKN